MPDRPLYLIEIDNPDHRRMWLTLLTNGQKGATIQKAMAARMTLPEAWCVLQHLSPVEHRIVPDNG